MFSRQFAFRRIKKKTRNKPFPLPEVPLADSLLLEVPLLDVPLAEVPQPLDPEPIDPEVAEQESSWRIMSNMSLDKELMSLLFPSPRELACENINITGVPLRKLEKDAALDTGICFHEELDFMSIQS